MKIVLGHSRISLLISVLTAIVNQLLQQSIFRGVINSSSNKNNKPPPSAQYVDSVISGSPISPEDQQILNAQVPQTIYDWNITAKISLKNL